MKEKKRDILLFKNIFSFKLDYFVTNHKFIFHRSIFSSDK